MMLRNGKLKREVSQLTIKLNYITLYLRLVQQKMWRGIVM